MCLIFLLSDDYGSSLKAAAPSQVLDKAGLLFLQSFNIIFNQYDLHVMLFFDRHPEYEAVEAMIQLKNEQPLIQVIVTRHDQTQIEYINDPEIPKLRQNSASNREIYYTPIGFFKSDGSVVLKFLSSKGEKVVFNLHTVGKATPTFGGLIDPEGHAKESVLPVMWSARNALANTKSSITIDGKDYQIPVKIRIPGFFTGLKGYYTEGFDIGVINTGNIKLEMVKTPEKFEIGQKWLIKKRALETVYQISEFDGCNFTISNMNNLERINGVVVNNRIMINSIEVMTSPESKEKMVVRFFPVLSELSGMLDTERDSASFQIDINEHQKVIQGKIEMKRENGRVIINFTPAKPRWAISRALHFEITMESNNHFMVQSSVIY